MTTTATSHTEREWEDMWESETATGTVYRPADDDEAAWQTAYDIHFARTGDDMASVGYADDKVYG